MAFLVPDTLYGVIGWPLAQTLSPLIHNTALRQLEIPAVYMAWPLPAQDLEAFIGAMRIMRINGLSVTIPHKVEVMKLLDNLSETAALVGAANTLFWRQDELCGDNTDVTGFLSPLVNILSDSMSVLLLGAGGAARAAAAGLKMSGCTQVMVASPGNRRQYELAERLAFMPVPWEDRYQYPAALIVNATPLGMTGKHVNDTPYDFEKGPAVYGWAYDLVYNPVMTRFLREAGDAGRKIIPGLEMFFEQGNCQFKLWTGRNLPEASRKALEVALSQK